MYIKQPYPQNLCYGDLEDGIDSGTIMVPPFGHDFVWPLEKAASLVDSILKGYPIGSFILWQTRESVQSARYVGGIAPSKAQSTPCVRYILDGQQRITSIYAAVKGVKIGGVDYSKIYVDLTASGAGAVVITDIANRSDADVISVKAMLEGGAAAQEQYASKIDEYREAFKNLLLVCITVQDAAQDAAAEIFARINSGNRPLFGSISDDGLSARHGAAGQGTRGKWKRVDLSAKYKELINDLIMGELNSVDWETVFETMAAKTYDAWGRFSLHDKCDTLLSELKDAGYGVLSREAVLQSMAICLKRECKKKVILRLDSDAFINSWDSISCAFMRAAKYCKTALDVGAPRLLPHDALLVPLTYWFYKYQRTPSADEQKYIADYFWRAVLTLRFESGAEAKLAQDIKRMDAIAQGKQPRYDTPVDISAEGLAVNGDAAGRIPLLKGMLCLLASLASKGQLPLEVNDALKTLLAQDEKGCGITDNDYNKFFGGQGGRMEMLRDKLRSRIVKTPLDKGF